VNTNSGSYTRYPALADLPPLVRRQRKFEALLGNEDGAYADQEKAVRKQIDSLLVDAGLVQGDVVTCNGYDVVRRGQKGRSSINVERLVESLVNAGLERASVLSLVLSATDTGDPSSWAEVKPSAGAKVRK